MPAPQVAVLQDGARLHYAVPVALQRAGMLERVFADLFLPEQSLRSKLANALARLAPGMASGLAGRRCPELDPAKVVQAPVAAVARGLKRRWRGGNIAFYEWEAGQRARWVERVGLGGADVLFGFVRNLDPRLCRWARTRGIQVVADQMIAPAEVERSELVHQHRVWPGWQDAPPWEEYDRLKAYEEATWEVLDLVTCPSDYVRRGLESVGVPGERIAVVPYPIAVSADGIPERRERCGSVTVGFVGQVSLRKGAPWFREVARRVGSSRVQFVMVGPSVLRSNGNRALSEFVRLVGRVPRSDIGTWLQRFDVFLFPSTCEGSAGSVLEAMASGLPVIISPNAGVGIEDGVEGFVRDYDDVEGMAKCIEELTNDVDVRHNMGARAGARVAEQGTDRYAETLRSALHRLVPRE